MERAAVDARHSTPRRCWPADPAQLGPIRADVRVWLASLRVEEETAEDLVLAVSEAASNAIEHAYAPGAAHPQVGIRLWTADGHVHAEITDHGSWREPPTGPSCRGHGITIMRGLVRSVSIGHADGGTTVLIRHPVGG